MSRKFRLYWYNGLRNFGDQLSPVIFEYVLGCKPSYAGKWNGDGICVGSIIEFATLRGDMRTSNHWFFDRLKAEFNYRLRTPLRIFGAGLMRPLSKYGSIRMRKAEVYALRGSLSLEELKREPDIYRMMGETSLGDPGLLLPKIYMAQREKRYKRGFVPHAYFWETDFVSDFSKEHPDVRLIDPRQDYKDVIDEIVSCEILYSSSLHGLVMADAYGVPNCWVIPEFPETDISSAAFKFYDYYSAFSVHREPCRAKDIFQGKICDPISPDIVQSQSQKIYQAIASAVSRK